MAPACESFNLEPAHGPARRARAAWARRGGNGGEAGTLMRIRCRVRMGNPPASGPTLRGDSRRPCVGLGLPGPGPAGKGPWAGALSGPNLPTIPRRPDARLGLLKGHRSSGILSFPSPARSAVTSPSILRRF
jgi:hypothetical protein